MASDARRAVSADPPIPPDGSCANCGKPRQVGDVKPLYRRAAVLDPFCSSPCARAWHGCALPERPRQTVTPAA